MRIDQITNTSIGDYTIPVEKELPWTLSQEELDLLAIMWILCGRKQELTEFRVACVMMEKGQPNTFRSYQAGMNAIDFLRSCTEKDGLFRKLSEKVGKEEGDLVELSDREAYMARDWFLDGQGDHSAIRFTMEKKEFVQKFNDFTDRINRQLPDLIVLSE